MSKFNINTVSTSDLMIPTKPNDTKNSLLEVFNNNLNISDYSFINEYSDFEKNKIVLSYIAKVFSIILNDISKNEYYNIFDIDLFNEKYISIGGFSSPKDLHMILNPGCGIPGVYVMIEYFIFGTAFGEGQESIRNYNQDIDNLFLNGIYRKGLINKYIINDKFLGPLSDEDKDLLLSDIDNFSLNDKVLLYYGSFMSMMKHHNEYGVFVLNLIVNFEKYCGKSLLNDDEKIKFILCLNFHNKLLSKLEGKILKIPSEKFLSKYIRYLLRFKISINS